MNPATKFIMLKQNMEGKDVIGISAVGEKIFMGLSYYFNEALTDLENSENYQFIFKTNRISGRRDAYGKGAQSHIVTKITDVNLTNLTRDSLNIVKSKLF
jgi:hypothetical protein